MASTGQYATQIHIPNPTNPVEVRRAIQQIRQYLVDLEGLLTVGNASFPGSGVVDENGYLLVNGDENIIEFGEFLVPGAAVVNGEENIIENGDGNVITWETVEDFDEGDIFIVA